MPKSSYKKVDIDYEYVIVDTGYTSRISTKEDSGCRKEFWASYGDEYPIGEDPNVELLFIFDDMWGTGLYREGKDKEEVDKLIRITKELDLYKYGIACFRCKKDCFRFIAGAIDASTYCRTFGVIDSCLYESDKEGEPSIMYMKWDSESG